MALVAEGQIRGFEKDKVKAESTKDLKVTELAQILGLSPNATTEVLKSARAKIKTLNAKRAGAGLTAPESAERNKLYRLTGDYYKAQKVLDADKVNKDQGYADLKAEARTDFGNYMRNPAIANRFELAWSMILDLKNRKGEDHLDPAIKSLEDEYKLEVVAAANLIVRNLEAGIAAAPVGFNVAAQIDIEVQAQAGGSVDQKLKDEVVKQQTRLEGLQRNAEAARNLDTALIAAPRSYTTIREAQRVFEATPGLVDPTKADGLRKVNAELTVQLDRAVRDIEGRARMAVAPAIYTDNVDAYVTAYVAAETALGNWNPVHEPEFRSKVKGRESEIQDDIDTKARQEFEITARTPGTTFDQIFDVWLVFTATPGIASATVDAARPVYDAELAKRYEIHKANVETVLKTIPLPVADVNAAIAAEIGGLPVGAAKDELERRLKAETADFQALFDTSGEKNLSQNAELFVTNVVSNFENKTPMPLTLIGGNNYTITDFSNIEAVLDQAVVDGVIDRQNRNAALEKIKTELLDKLRAKMATEMRLTATVPARGSLWVAAPPMVNPFAERSWALQEITYRTVSNYLTPDMAQTLVADVNRIHKEAVDEFKKAAVPGMTEAQWTAAFTGRSQEIIAQGKSELLLDAKDPENEHFKELKKLIDDLIKNEDAIFFNPQLAPNADRVLRNPYGIAELRTLINARNILNWAEVQQMLDGIAPRRGSVMEYADARFRAQYLKNRLLVIDANPEAVRGIIEADLIGSLQSPPLSPSEKDYALKEFKRMIEDAKDKAALAKIRKGWSSYKALGAIGGPLATLGVLGLCGALSTAWMARYSPMLLAILLGIGVGVGIPSVNKIRDAWRVNKITRREYDRDADAVKNTVVRFGEEFADSLGKAEPKDIAAMVKKYSQEVRSVKIRSNIKPDSSVSGKEDS
jgi:hypothetical protein